MRADVFADCEQWRLEEGVMQDVYDGQRWTDFQMTNLSYRKLCTL